MSGQLNVTLEKCYRIAPGDGIPCIHYLPSSDAKEAGFCDYADRYRCTEAIKELAMRLSHSTIQDYLRCNMLYYYKQVRGIEVKDALMPEAVKAGKLLDMMMEIMYNKVSPDNDTYNKKIQDYIMKSNVSDITLAKVRAVYRAYKDYIELDMNGFIGTQQHFEYHHWDEANGDVLIHGYYDVLYTDHFDEYKFTSSPDNYSKPFYIDSQVGTYFLVNPALEYCNLKVIKSPDINDSPVKIIVEKYF